LTDTSFFQQWLKCQECEKIINRLEKKGVLTDYHYQNSTDRPDGVSNKEWREREKVWDEIFKNHGKPSQAGFSIDFHESICEICWNFKENPALAKQIEKQREESCEAKI
jgi:hypothetical protein